MIGPKECDAIVGEERRGEENRELQWKILKEKGKVIE
jgi:hypothetical protein